MGVVRVSNRCPVCGGYGRLVAFGATDEPIPVPCPECAGLAVTPASADDHLARRVPDPEPVTFLLEQSPPAPSDDAGEADDGEGLERPASKHETW